MQAPGWPLCYCHVTIQQDRKRYEPPKVGSALAGSRDSRHRVFCDWGRQGFRASYDFVPVYTGARCLLHRCNPYDTEQLQQQFSAGGGRPTELPSWEIDMPVYPPSTFLVLSPLALLRFPIARLLWFLLNGCLLVTSAGLILSLCRDPTGGLLPRWHHSSWQRAEFCWYWVNPATFAISLVIIGCYLFLRGRLLPLGAFLFMLSLAVKPQIGGLIVLYLLAQRIHWRYGRGSDGRSRASSLRGPDAEDASSQCDWTSTLARTSPQP